MNIHYPAPEHASRSVPRQMTAILLLVGLVLTLPAVSQPVWVKLHHPTTIITTSSIPDNQVIPWPVPVPEPPRDQLALALSAGATRVPQETQLRPVPESVPTPPANR